MRASKFADGRFVVVMLPIFNMVGTKSVTNARHKLTGQFPCDGPACVTQAGLIKDFGNWGH